MPGCGFEARFLLAPSVLLTDNRPLSRSPGPGHHGPRLTARRRLRAARAAAPAAPLRWRPIASVRGTTPWGVARRGRTAVRRLRRWGATDGRECGGDSGGLRRGSRQTTGPGMRAVGTLQAG